MTVDNGCFVSDVTYTGYWSPWDQPGYLVALTVAPNAVTTQHGVEDRNGAAALGLRIDFPDGDENPYSSRNGVHDRFPGLVGDTLCVNLDLSSLERDPPFLAAPESEEIVATTVECLKLNARRGWPRIRVLALNVRGPAVHHIYAGTFPLDDISCTPQPRSVERRGGR